MATRTISNRVGLDKAVARLGRLLSWIASEEARLQRSVDYHTSRIDKRKGASHDKTRGWEAERDAVAVAIFEYADPRQGELLEKGRNYIKIATGRIGWDRGRVGATAYPKGEEEAVKAIESRLTPDQINRILGKTIRKNPLKEMIEEDPSILDVLADVIEIPLVDRLVIDPDNHKKGFRRPITWFQRLLEPQAA